VGGDTGSRLPARVAPPRPPSDSVARRYSPTSSVRSQLAPVHTVSCADPSGHPLEKALSEQTPPLKRTVEALENQIPAGLSSRDTKLYDRIPTHF